MNLPKIKFESDTDSDELEEKTNLPKYHHNSPGIKNEYYIIKCAIIGEPHVGKTAILTRYTQNIFKEKVQPTIGIDYFLKKIDIKNSENDYQVKLHLWDTAGQEKFKSLVNSYLRSCYLFFIVFDITRWETFVRCAWWLQQIFNYRKILDKETNHKYPIVLVGNMSDCNKREVSKQVAIDWAEENNLIGYYEVSAKEGINLENLFEDSVCEVMNSNNLQENVDNVSSGISYYSSNKKEEPKKHSKIVIRNVHKNSSKQKCCYNI